jgi:hypothetical protein
VAAVALALAPPARRLRVGLFADARRQPRWLVEAFAKAAAADFCEVAAIAVVAGAAASPPPALARAYGRLDRWAFGAEPCDPLDLPAAVPHRVLLEGEGWSVRDVVPLRLDVAFALGDFDDRLLDGLARYGVWRYALDGEGEVARGEPLTGAGITVRLAAGAARRLAYESWSRTYPLSVARNRRALLIKAAEFAHRALRDAHRSGLGWLEQCRVFKNGSGDPHRGLEPILKIGSRIARRGIEKALSVEQWSLAFRFGGGELDPRLEGFTRILPPGDRDWADPFALEKDGRHYVFFEELLRAEGKGRIAMTEVDASGRWSTPVTVLERDYHVSYPFLLEHQGALYMVPETAQKRTVELYRCTEFPSRWKLEKVLLEGVRLVDPTLHRGPDRWWLFANGAPGESRVFDDELYLHHARELLGEWQPHRRNPVKSDARSTRPAGRTYWRNGALHRPAQICAPRFGFGLAIQRVLRLTPEDYAERQVARVLPQAGILGLHTVNRAGPLTVIDVFAARRRI